MRKTEQKSRPLRWLESARLLSRKPALLSVLLAIGPAVACAQTTPVAGRPSMTWESFQKQQAWATAKIAASRRRHEWVTLQRDGRAMRALVTYPQGVQKSPVILVLHEVFGLTDSTLNTADEIAAMGFITIAPDMISGKGPGGGNVDSFPDSTTTSNAMTSMPQESVDADINAWAAYGLSLPQANAKLAVVGVSWGGGAAFRYADSPSHDPRLKAVVVFYDVGPPAVTQGPKDGKPKAPHSVTAIDVPIYGFYGSLDKRVMDSLSATTEAMREAGKFYEPVVYEDASHAFMRVGDQPGARDADVKAVQESLARVKRILQGL